MSWVMISWRPHHIENSELERWELNTHLELLIHVSISSPPGHNILQFASVKFWGNSESGNSGERLVWGLASLSDFFSVPYLKKVKFWGNSGESQGNLKISYLKPKKMQGSSGKTQEKLKKSFLKPIKVQGNSGETQKIIFKAYKSAGKLGGNSKNHY